MTGHLKCSQLADTPGAGRTSIIGFAADLGDAEGLPFRWAEPSLSKPRLGRPAPGITRSGSRPPEQERSMSDEDGIRRTIANYCRLFDAKQWDELGKIFTEDASVTSRRGTFTGRVDVIRDLKSAMTEEYHGTLFMSNTVITVDAGTARAVSDFLEVEDNKILAVGTYTDTLAKTADSWLLASKEIRLK
jgi:hypothetical protein